MSDMDYSYEYDGDTKYCYPGTAVLRNKLGITDSDKFDQAERSITFLRMLIIDEIPIEGNFDLNHLKSIHKFIFQDIFDWAGELRTVNISKGTMFCNYNYLIDNAGKLFNELKSEDYLCNLDYDQMVERVAYYLGEINAIHPFREGNGRTQRKFMQLLVSKVGYELDFSAISDVEMIEASSDAFLHDHTKMIQIIARSLTKRDG